MPVDLDALGAARREALKEAPEVIFKGESFLLPPEPDGRIIELLANVALLGEQADDPAKMAEGANAIHVLCKSMLGDEWDRFAALQPSLMDLMALAEAFPDLYGLDSGESPASPSPSPSTSER
jgi:hypothetical protein